MTEQTPNLGSAFDEAASWGVGLGIIVMALFPLALPLIALTAVAAIALGALGLALGIPAVVIASPVLLLRQRRRTRTSQGGQDESVRGWCDGSNRKAAGAPFDCRGS